MTEERSSSSAYLAEIFSSIQGEGLLVGCRQLFIRFAGCAAACDYCDTPESRVQGAGFLVHNVGAYSNTPLPNPVTTEKLTDIIKSFSLDIHHSISLTGGEPLEQSGFLREWLSTLRRGMACHAPTTTYLETNGLLPDRLREVVDMVDIIGMDIKLPSSSGMAESWDIHRQFLKIACSREVFVKVVFGGETSVSEIDAAAEVVRSVDPDIPMILQPRTPLDMETSFMLKMQERATGVVSEVRVIPQVHKFMKVM